MAGRAARGRAATAALSSPFNRALTTAQLATRGLDVRVRTDERLRERDFGAFDGMTGAGIREQYPDEAKRRDLLGKFYYRPPGGESWADVALRIRSVLATEGLRYDCERLLVVAHQAVIMVFRYVLEELTEQELLEVDRDEQVANASLTRYDRDADGNLRLTSFNEVEHLTDEDEEVTEEPDAAPHPDPTIVTPEVLRAWQLPEPDRRQEHPRLDPGDRRQLGDSRRGAARGRGGDARGRGQAPGRHGRVGRPVAAAALPEALVRSLPETDGGAIRADAADAVRDLAEAADAVLIGPGMADKEVTQEFGARLLPHLRGPARARRARAGLRDRRRRLPAPPRRPGRADAEPDRAGLRAARRGGRGSPRPGRRRRALAGRTRAVVGLGGATSWVAAPDGTLWRDDSGAAGLGVSGSGDVRAGITGGLLARGADPAQAAVWAAFLHGRCGERLSSTVGRLGFLARELPPEIPRALAEITG